MKKIMQQIQRIMQMEEILRETQQVIDELSPLLEKYHQLQAKISVLSKYYQSDEWKQDFADDEQGKFPPTLKRGVLSEDTVWNMLQDEQHLKQQLIDIINFQAA